MGVVCGDGGVVSQAELQFTSLSHDESCDRAQLSLRRSEPQISDHLLLRTHPKKHKKTQGAHLTQWGHGDPAVEPSHRIWMHTSALLQT